MFSTGLMENVSPFNVSLMHPTSMDDENNNTGDDFVEGDNMVQESSMQLAMQGDEDDTEQFENIYANNEYVGPKIRILMSFRMMVG